MQVLQVLQVLFRPTHQSREKEDEDEEEGGAGGKGMGGTEWKRKMRRCIWCGRGAWAPQAAHAHWLCLGVLEVTCSACCFTRFTCCDLRAALLAALLALKQH